MKNWTAFQHPSDKHGNFCIAHSWGQGHVQGYSYQKAALQQAIDSAGVVVVVVARVPGTASLQVAGLHEQLVCSPVALPLANAPETGLLQDAHSDWVDLAAELEMQVQVAGWMAQAEHCSSGHLEVGP